VIAQVLAVVVVVWIGAGVAEEMATSTATVSSEAITTQKY